MKLRYPLTIVFVMFCFDSFAQAQKSKSDSLTIDDFYMDFSVPDITAFSILGIEPSSISKPGNVKEFALGITNFVNRNGDLRAGLAVEWAPFKTFNGKTGNWENKTNNRAKFEWKNITTSLATTNDSTNVRLGWGLRFSPIDLTNPLNNKEWVNSLNNFFYSIIKQQKTVLDNAKLKFMDEVRLKFTQDLLINPGSLQKLSSPLEITKLSYLTKLKEKYEDSGLLYDRFIVEKNVLDSLRTIFIKEGYEDLFITNESLLKTLANDFTDLFYQQFSQYPIEREFSTRILEMKKEFKKNNWNKWSLQISAGGALNSEDATLNDMQGQYSTFAFTTGFPLISANWFKNTTFNDFMRKHSQIILHARGSNYVKQDSIQNNETLIGSRILIGNHEKRFSFELAYIGLKNDLTKLDQAGIRYSIGAEIKIMNNYWLEFAVGGQNFEDKTKINILPRFAFRHAFGNENRFYK